MLIGVGPDADCRAKLLIYRAMEGSILDAYLHSSLLFCAVARCAR